MTGRIGQPDTDADRELRGCLDQRPLRSFIMIAGAGSGKTTSLVKALDHLARTAGAELRRRGQHIACITYTEIAVGEIWADVGNAPLFHVSTIHSFLWTLVRPFQREIREWVLFRIDEKITDARERLSNPRTRAQTRAQLEFDVERYLAQRAEVERVARFNYGTGSKYSNGILGHDDILKIGPKLIAERPLLRALIARRFPFIFVDESQDTNPTFVDALKLIANSVGEGFCLGFFGDPMQKIYMTGIGPIAPGENWNRITKQENFRCPRSVLNAINRIRAEDDGLQQTRGRTVERDGVTATVEGSARIFILRADRRSERLARVRNWLANMNADTLWESDGDVRVLILVHRTAAQRLGFPDLYSALNDGAPVHLKEGVADGTAWVLRPFMTYILPLVQAVHAHAEFEAISLLRRNCPLLANERLAGQNISELLAQLKEDVDRLSEMFRGEPVRPIRDVLSFIRDRELAVLDPDFEPYLDVPENTGGVAGQGDQDEHASVSAYLTSPAQQLLAYRTYIENQSPFSTQQGVKGAEFQRVLVVLDDEEGADYSLFSYGKYLGTTALSDRDRNNIAEGADSVVSRTRRLFYVCCSRALQDLAVVWFVPNVGAAREAIAAKGFFDANNIHLFDD